MPLDQRWGGEDRLSQREGSEGAATQIPNIDSKEGSADDCSSLKKEKKKNAAAESSN